MLSLLMTLLLNTAAAGDAELSLQTGGIVANPSAGWHAFSPSPGPGLHGARVGIPLSDVFLVLGEYEGGMHGVVHHTTESDERIRLGFTEHLALVGVKAQLPVDYPLTPYLAAEGGLAVASMRIDENRRDRQNLNQLRVTELGGAGYGALGLQFAPPHDFGPVGFGVHFEVGYTLQSGLDFADMGAINPGGVTLRLGSGLRF